MWTFIKYSLAVAFVIFGLVVIVVTFHPIGAIPLVLGIFIFEREENIHAGRLAALREQRRRAEDAARPASSYWPPSDRF